MAYNMAYNDTSHGVINQNFGSFDTYVLCLMFS